MKERKMGHKFTRSCKTGASNFSNRIISWFIYNISPEVCGNGSYSLELKYDA